MTELIRRKGYAPQGLRRRKGYGDDSLRAVVHEEAPHDESAWAARFPEAVDFLLAPS